MNIVYIFDNNYASISGVSIYSLLKHNVEVDNIKVIIIDGGISESNKKNLSEICRIFDRTITFITPKDPEEEFDIRLDISSWSKSNYVRLLLDKVIPNDIDRILYIDSDTLINNNLLELYRTDMGESVIGASYDCYPLPKYQLGLSIHDKYYSDGVLLVNLKKWRELNLFRKFKNYLHNKNGKVPYLEQGAINDVLRDEIYLLDSKYNVMTLTYVYRNNPTCFYEDNEPYYSSMEAKESAKNPYIVHLTGHPLCIRPWNKSSNHPFRNEWIAYLKNTPWKDDFRFSRIKSSHYYYSTFRARVIFQLMRFRFIERHVFLNSYQYKKICEMRKNFNN